MNLFIASLLSDKGEVSAMRLMSIFSLLVGASVAVYGVYKGKDLSGVAQICGVFVVSAFSGKAIQKVVEK